MKSIQKSGIQQTIHYLNYNGPLIHPYELDSLIGKKNTDTSESREKKLSSSIIPSVEIKAGCKSEGYLFYRFLKQGFVVSHSTFFGGTHFRVRYFNYPEGAYWP